MSGSTVYARSTEVAEPIYDLDELLPEEAQKQAKVLEILQYLKGPKTKLSLCACSIHIHGYVAIDELVDDDSGTLADLFLTEFLNERKGAGLPPCRLIHEIGHLAMRIRNLKPAEDLCNGTRMIIKRLRPKYIVVRPVIATV